MPRQTKKLYLKLETTGSHPIAHGIYMLSALIEVDGKEVAKVAHIMKPCNLNTAVEHEVPEGMDSFPEASDAHRDFSKWLQYYDSKYHPYVKYTPVCIGNTFEFMNHWMASNFSQDWSRLQNFRQVDVLSLVRLMCDWGDKGLQNLANHRMDTLCYYFKIPLPKPGLESVLVMREVYKQLTRRMAKMVRGEK